MQVRRLGGAFGCKISRSVHVATACAVAAHNVRKPVRVVMDLESNMKLIGKRLPYYSKYEVRDLIYSLEQLSRLLTHWYE